MKSVFKTFLILVSAFLIILLGLSFFLGYESMVELVLDVTNRQDRREHAFLILTSGRFIIFQFCLFFSLILALLIAYKLDTVLYYINRFCYYLWTAIKNIYFDVKSRNALIILMIPLISSVYFALTVPISADEGVTYYLFTIKPFYYCMIFYPYPNNHVLHSILTNVTEYMPFFNTLFCLRLPAIIASFVCWCVAYSFIKKYYSEKVAMLIVALSAILFRSIYYSFMSRGYALLVLFFIISLYAAYNIINKGNRSKDWTFFVVSGILGCYAIPSFLYPFATLNILLLVFNYRSIKKQIFFNILAGIGIIILYAPIMLVTGIDALVNNPHVSPYTMTRLEVLQELPVYINDVLHYLFHSISYYTVIFFILLSLIWLVVVKDKNKLILWLIFGVSPFVLLLIHNVIPFPRTLVYYGFIIIFLIGISFSKYINRISIKFLIPALLFIQISGFLNFKLNIGEDETFNTEFKVLNEKIIGKNTTYNITSSYSRYNLLFEVISRGYDVENVLYNNRHEVYINADTINNVDYVIIDIPKDQTTQKKVYYSDRYHHVYKNN